MKKITQLALVLGVAASGYALASLKLTERLSKISMKSAFLR